MRSVVPAAGIDLYTCPNGLDTYDGLSAAWPLRTLQRAWDLVRDNYDLAGNNVRVNVAGGSGNNPSYKQGLLARGLMLGQANHKSISFLGYGHPLPVIEGMTEAITADNAMLTVGRLNIKPWVDPAVAGSHAFVSVNRATLNVVGYNVIHATSPNQYDLTADRGAILLGRPEDPSLDCSFELYGRRNVFIYTNAQALVQGRVGLYPQGGVHCDYAFAAANGLSYIGLDVANAGDIGGQITSRAPKVEAGGGVVMPDMSFVGMTE